MRNFSILISILISTSAFSQQNNVQSAATALGLVPCAYMKDGETQMGMCIKVNYDELERAKKFIDLAAEHPQTAGDPKMWYFRGRIYLEIHRDTTRAQKIDPDAIAKATKSLVNYLKADEKKLYTDSAQLSLMHSAIDCFYEGVRLYKNKDYNKAGDLYNLVLEAVPYDTRNDLIRNNVSEKTVYLNLFFASKTQGNNKKSKSYLQKLIELGYNDPLIYVSMSKILLEEKDTLKALEYIDLGRKKFYDDIDLIKEQVDLYLKTGKIGILQKKLDSDIEYDPYNMLLYFIRGNLFEKQSMLAEAEKDYLKTVELDPAFFAANYNLGAIYYNQGADIINAAKDIVSNTAYEKEKEKADAKFKKAIPYFESANQVKPDDVYTIQKLKLLYARTGDTAKFELMKKKLDEIGN